MSRLGDDLASGLKIEALRLGFDAAGIAPAVGPPHYPDYLGWLEAGRAGPLGYLERQAPLRAHPDQLLSGARSMVVVLQVYGAAPTDTPQPPASSGKIAQYARGATDYHPLFWRRLESLLAWVQEREPSANGRAVCDSAPLLERDFAMLAGLGWVGKNTLLLSRTLGSYTLLGALLLDIDLPADGPFTADHCGTCTRCIDACPTGAIVSPRTLDARRCISTWTIEAKGPLPQPQAEALHGWVFGCDICQDVCPWNRKAARPREPELAPRSEWVDPDLIAWLVADPAEFQARLKGTALKRAGRAGLIRNACLVLAQRGESAAIPALIGLLDDADSTVRWAARQAIETLDTPETAGAACRGVEESGS
jgi:epoxyqueuosine reductase